MSTTTHHKENSPRANHGSGAPKLPKRRDHVATPAVYKVKSGDTLFQIAQRFGVPMKRICSLNGNLDQNKLVVGQEIRLSGSPSPTPSRSGARYVKIKNQWYEQCPELSDKFLALVVKYAKLLGTKPMYLLGVMFHETFHTMHPACPSLSSSAKGLIQFIGKGAEEAGLRPDKIAGMTREQQMPYVYNYFKRHKGKIGTLEGLYLATIRPGSLYDKDNVVFAGPGVSYKANESLDANKDNKITRYEIAAKVRVSYDLACKVYGEDLRRVESKLKRA